MWTQRSWLNLFSWVSANDFPKRRFGLSDQYYASLFHVLKIRKWFQRPPTSGLISLLYLHLCGFGKVVGIFTRIGHPDPSCQLRGWSYKLQTLRTCQQKRLHARHRSKSERSVGSIEGQIECWIRRQCQVKYYFKSCLKKK